MIVTCRRRDWTLDLKEVNLFVVVKEAEVVFLQYKRSTCCRCRETKHRTHFPPFLLCNNLHMHHPSLSNVLQKSLPSLQTKTIVRNRIEPYHNHPCWLSLHTKPANLAPSLRSQVSLKNTGRMIIVHRNMT